MSENNNPTIQMNLSEMRERETKAFHMDRSGEKGHMLAVIPIHQSMISSMEGNNTDQFPKTPKTLLNINHTNQFIIFFVYSLCRACFSENCLCDMNQTRGAKNNECFKACVSLHAENFDLFSIQMKNYMRGVLHRAQKLPDR